jgi:hypothetical protein
MDLARYALVGAALGLVLGTWNLVSFWLNPLDDSVGGMLVVYGPMFVAWLLVGVVAARSGAGLGGAVKAGAVTGFATFAVFWLANVIRVNLFLDLLRDWPGWETVVARYRVSGFESFRAFTNYEYLLDAPLKLSVPTVLGATLALIGGLVTTLNRDSGRSEGDKRYTAQVR